MSCPKNKGYQNHIEMVGIEKLIPYAKNSRTHSDEQVAQLAGSIREFGFTNPILIDANSGIIAGHGRVLAARKLELLEVPCIRLAHLSETQKRAYVIADNKLALNAGWDEEMLGLELNFLREEINLEMIGFSADELKALMSVEIIEGTDPDEVPEAPEDPVTELGDIWTLGDHRIMCGNSTSIDNIETLLDGAKWDCLIFDPPYEQESLYSTAMLPQKEGAKLIIFWDFKRFACAAKCAMEFGWTPLYELIWDNVTSWFTPNRPLARHKACGIFGDDPKWNFEAAIIKDGKKREAKTVSNTRGDCDYIPLNGAVHLRTVEAFPTTSENGGHCHSKPMKWIEAIFRGVGKSVFLDLFAGSGTTVMACEIIGTTAFALELNPVNVDIILNRWQAFTGKKALHKSGKTFDELKIKQK